MPRVRRLAAGAETARFVAGSAPVAVTVAPTMTALLGSTTVTRSVALPAGCAKALNVGTTASRAGR